MNDSDTSVDLDSTQHLDQEKMDELTRNDGTKCNETACLIVLSGSLSVGRFYVIDREATVGRAHTADIRLDEDGVSRKHARVIPTPDGRVLIEDLGSTNGTFVNGTRVAARELQDGDKIRVGPIPLLKFSFLDSVESSFHEHVYESATKDSLTGFLNRRFLEMQMPAELAFAHRQKRSVSVAWFDIDQFKHINDTHGHPAGDHVLRELAATLKSCRRQQDIFVRYGGDEFVLFMRELDEQQAMSAAERLRAAVEEMSITYCDKPILVTVSVGVVVLTPEYEIDAPALLKAADEALYRAKNSGRNQTVGTVLS